MTVASKPTDEFYGALTRAYAHFNKRLFNGQLPACLITAQRQRNVMGYFSKNRWNNGAGDVVHEIALNPSYFGNHKIIEVFQTLVHEQCHLWQHEFAKPSRGGYHNKQFAERMLAIGLVPSDTGAPGGKTTGQRMSDYPDPDGLFLKACKELARSDNVLPWVDRFPAYRESCQVRESSTDGENDNNIQSDVENILFADFTVLIPSVENDTPPPVAKNKVKYSCIDCGINVWGKTGLNLACTDCDMELVS
ncbi:MAG: SprT-like domain-containing protein [Gammaproteobacteria bacterium]|nr:SprT-like domain-containing protein [Gammaproteobacteria bacterium]